MAVVIGGHIRSGTTLLRNLLNSHPDITITMEFSCFLGLDRPFKNYARQVVRHWWDNRNRSFLIHKSENQWRLIVHSHIFVMRYLSAIYRLRGNSIDVATIEAALQHVLRSVPVVGDKMPSYIFQLDTLAEVENVVPIIVYRDCRDVTSSTLEMVCGKWSTMAFAHHYDTAAKVAVNWVRAVEAMESHSHQINLVRYEYLVSQPRAALATLARWLSVDPGGFHQNMVHASSVGRYRERLSKQELSAVMDIAGSTMARLGYI